MISHCLIVIEHQCQRADGEQRDAGILGGPRKSRGSAQIPGGVCGRIASHQSQRRNVSLTRGRADGCHQMPQMDGKSN